MPSNRDLDVISHILRYCQQVETAHADFGCSKERFIQSTTYQNAVCMCILQIGELIGRLSEDFQEKHSDIPWHKIRGMRNFAAHEWQARSGYRVVYCHCQRSSAESFLQQYS